MSTSNGWHTLIKPGDEVRGILSAHYGGKGTVTIWHRTAVGYRVTVIQPDGNVRQATGQSKKAAWTAANV